MLISGPVTSWFIALLLAMAGVVPVRNAADAAYRSEIADALLMLDATAHERALLVRIAGLESSFSRRIAECRYQGREGDAGASLGLWQVQPRTQDERELLCGPVLQQAAIALARVRESLASCGDLSGYTCGHCQPSEPKARARWVSP